MKKSAFPCYAVNREGCRLESPVSDGIGVSLWSGVSDKDMTVCPVTGILCVSIKELPDIQVGNQGGTAIYSSLTVLFEP